MSADSSRVRGALRYLLCWLLLVVVYGVMLVRNGISPSFGYGLYWAACYLLPSMLVGGAWWTLAGKIRWAGLDWKAAVAAELALDVAYLVVWNLGFFAVVWAVSSRDHAWQRAGFMVTGWPIFDAVLIIGLHSAVFHTRRISRALRERERAAVEAEALRVKAEMQALRGQLNPHFLFNSLHSITALVRDQSPQAEEALLQFSALLRRVLDVSRDSADEVTLAEEMAFIGAYLDIERLRLGERLGVTLDIAPAATDCLIPVFSVQPLVENAVLHAIAPRRTGGTLTVRADVRAGQLEISVSDDGPGTDPAKLADATGVGLGVIRKRLTLRHGERGGMAVDNQPGRGFAVTLTLPAVREAGT